MPACVATRLLSLIPSPALLAKRDGTGCGVIDNAGLTPYGTGQRNIIATPPADILLNVRRYMHRCSRLALRKYCFRRKATTISDLAIGGHMHHSAWFPRDTRVSHPQSQTVLFTTNQIYKH
jgi:hypothetical protein